MALKKLSISALSDYIANEREAEEIASGTIKIIEFARKNNVDTIVVSGSSAQPVAFVFRHLWRQLFPGEKMPRFCALGTIPYRLKRNIGESWAKAKGDETLKNAVPGGRRKRKRLTDGEMAEMVRRDIEIAKKRWESLEKNPQALRDAIAERFPEIRQAKSAMVLDEYQWYGATAENIKKALVGLGIPKVLKSALYAHYDPNYEVDFAAFRFAETPKMYTRRRANLAFERGDILQDNEEIGLLPKAQRREGAKILKRDRARLKRVSTLRPMQIRQARRMI